MMKNKVDLYDYFDAERYGASEGYLTICADNKKRCPAMLVIAGGGYEHVSLREQDSVAKRYSENGYKAFILHYTTKVSYPTAFFEACLAMAYIRKNADELGVISDKVVGVGFSAGGHLLGCLGIIYDDDAIKKSLNEVAYFRDKDWEKIIKPDAMILSYPVITSLEGKRHNGSFERIANGDNDLIDRLSLENRVNERSAPAFIWHTFEDSTVPVYGSIALAAAYEKFAVPFSLHIFGKGKHGLSVATTEVNSKEDIENASTGLSGWLELSLNWLKDMGF